MFKTTSNDEFNNQFLHFASTMRLQSLHTYQQAYAPVSDSDNLMFLLRFATELYSSMTSEGKWTTQQPRQSTFKLVTQDGVTLPFLHWFNQCLNCGQLRCAVNRCTQQINQETIRKNSRSKRDEMVEKNVTSEMLTSAVSNINSRRNFNQNTAGRGRGRGYGCGGCGNTPFNNSGGKWAAPKNGESNKMIIDGKPHTWDPNYPNNLGSRGFWVVDGPDPGLNNVTGQVPSQVTGAPAPVPSSAPAPAPPADNNPPNGDDLSQMTDQDVHQRAEAANQAYVQWATIARQRALNSQGQDFQSGRG